MQHNNVKVSEKKEKQKKQFKDIARKNLEKKDALIKANSLVEIEVLALQKAKEKEKEAVKKLEKKDK
jgi:hypothetical protein